MDNAAQLRKELSLFKDKAADLESERNLLEAEVKAHREDVRNY